MSIARTDRQVADPLHPGVAFWSYQHSTDRYSAFGWQQFGFSEEPSCYASWLDLIHAEDRHRVDEQLRSQMVCKGDVQFQFEYRLAPCGGENATTVLLRGQRGVASDGATELVTTSVNVGPLRELSEQLAIQAESFQSIADSAPALIWVTDRSGRCEWFNQRWLEFTGSTMEAALIRGRFGNAHPDDQDDAIRCFQAAISHRDPIEVDYRLRNARGEYRWMLDRAFPRYDRDGCFAGYVGTCIDVSNEREYAQQLVTRAEVMKQLHDLSEREKSFMACAIHDGLLQDIIGADMLLQGCETLSSEKQEQRINLARKTIRAAIGHGRRLISELRPMILDEQGLVCAIEFYAAELENRSKLDVTVTSDLVGEVGCSLWGCNVFRIVQEALNNIEAHSGVRQATVHLSRQDDQLCVAIRDQGAGFDYEAARESFGILCMRERASIFGGMAQIDSKVGVGTTVYIEIPLPAYPM